MAKDRNQGEGDKESARRYNEATKKFARSGKVAPSAREAKRAREGGAKDELERAEEVGRSKAKEFDPQVKRDPRRAID